MSCPSPCRALGSEGAAAAVPQAGCHDEYFHFWYKAAWGTSAQVENLFQFLRYIGSSQLLITCKDPVPKSHSDQDSVVLLEEVGVSAVLFRLIKDHHDK